MADRTLNSNTSIVRQTSYQEEQIIIEHNSKVFEEILALGSPELLVIWKNLQLYNVNPMVLPFVIRAIGNIIYSSRYGDVVIHIEPEGDTAVIKEITAIDKTEMELRAQKIS